MARLQRESVSETLVIWVVAVPVCLALPFFLVMSWLSGPALNPPHWPKLAMLFVPGALVAAINFFSSFLRYPLHRLRGRTPGTFRFVSGLPAIGTILIGLAVLLAWGDVRGVVIAAVLCVLDTAGLPWFLISMIHASIRERLSSGLSSNSTPPSTEK